MPLQAVLAWVEVVASVFLCSRFSRDSLQASLHLLYTVHVGTVVGDSTLASPYPIPSNFLLASQRLPASQQQRVPSLIVPVPPGGPAHQSEEVVEADAR